MNPQPRKTGRAPATGDAPEPRPKRRRDPDASRAAILKAAREVFTERGYAGGTIREIAKRAGVTHGLVMRHFGSKEQLLVAALPGASNLSEVIPGDVRSLPERLAHEFVRLIDTPGGYPSLVALIRTGAAREEVVGPLYAELERQTNAAYREVLGEGADAYVDFIRALLIGVAFIRQIAGTGSMATMASDELATRLAAAIRAVLAPALPAP
ncbi:MAG TPA: TetR family transcriptional regulator [Solirubrobacteraceae bacterium]|nr:TetR family transcriptional regulator [Solirubrobacteraceae bacterium]